MATAKKSAAPRKAAARKTAPKVELSSPGYELEVEGKVTLLLQKRDGSMGEFVFHPNDIDKSGAEMAWIMRDIRNIEETGNFGVIADLVEEMLPPEEVRVVRSELSMEALPQVVFALFGGDPS